MTAPTNRRAPVAMLRENLSSLGDDEVVFRAAAMALEHFAVIMDRAGQPAAALGASLLAMQLSKGA